MTTLAIVSATVGDEIKAFRSSCVTSENRSTPFVRSLLANFVSSAMGVSALEAAIVHSFGNVKTAKGKPAATVSALRSALGGTAVYQTWKSFLSLVDMIDADAPVTGEDGTVTGDGSIRKAIVGFILSDASAPANLKTLLETCKASLKAFTALTMPSNEEASAENDAAAPAPADAAPAPVSLNDRALALLVAFQSASDDERNAAYDTIGLIVDAMNAAIEGDADAAPVAIAA